MSDNVHEEVKRLKKEYDELWAVIHDAKHRVEEVRWNLSAALERAKYTMPENEKSPERG